ncbi:hypothetical protein [Polaribacter sp. IC073]|uniref:hypothetical protein n=1 Tax=Polaribacter sp. IC073 TaxID=2508540 RepID=UPI0011BDC0FD|nr:hypothetical protein [Polaribacter sp. IC073]TXD48897.1 hypothetical protein ES045_06650 [Polaribacter sp. IC073]
MNNESTNELDFIRKYEAEGYTNSYRVRNDILIENESDIGYTPFGIKVVAKHRYEGDSNPSDMSILYVIETKDGTKGTILMPYGNTNETETLEFFNKIPEENFSESENIMFHNKKK